MAACDYFVAVSDYIWAIFEYIVAVCDWLMTVPDNIVAVCFSTPLSEPAPPLAQYRGVKSSVLQMKCNVVLSSGVQDLA